MAIERQQYNSHLKTFLDIAHHLCYGGEWLFVKQAIIYLVLAECNNGLSPHSSCSSILSVLSARVWNADKNREIICGRIVSL